MKKVLISVLIVLLVILAYVTIFEGLSFGNFKILSVENIVQANDELTNNIGKVKSLLEKDFPEKKEVLSTSVIDLLDKKEEYFKIAKVSTEGEITKANTEETYLIEYLWTRVGRHATSNGVNLRMDVNSGDTGEADMKNLAFTVTGEYIGIIDFISDIENDDKLNFKIENFKMVKNSTNLTATFTVRSVRIKTETTSATTSNSVQEETGNTEVTTDTENNQVDTNAVNETTNIVNNINVQ